MENPPNPQFDATHFLKTLPGKPGVYRMLDDKAKVIYVGKARDLKKRVSSYFQKNITDAKTKVLVRQICDIQVTITHTENEALILESTLIKELSPRYNVLFRDDKSYPYIFLSNDPFPRLSLYRGSKKAKGRYFGPYPNAGAARETLKILQKIFQIRQCENVFFNNRSRPCLQYQIKRCTAPCVKLIDKARYQESVGHAVMLLEGRNNDVIDDLIERMETASSEQNYEKAAILRDQIGKIRQIQEQQYVSREGRDTDIIVVLVENGIVCVQVVFIRAGRLLGNKAFFPKVPEGSTYDEILTQFLPQFYLNRKHDIPANIIVNHPLSEVEWVTNVLSEEGKQSIKIAHSVRGQRAKWLSLSEKNAKQALLRKLSDKMSIHERYLALQEALGLDQMPQHLECFDISHTFGESTVASCVVFDENGPLTSQYRRFNIEGITGGDDYAAMHQALTRRYTRLRRGEGRLPDLLVIDGGKGQLHQAEKVLEELQVTGVSLLAIAKGPSRKPGLEVLYLSGRSGEIHLEADSLALHLLQHIRDESHRFAIAGHRHKRAKTRNTSSLEGIPGVGAQRRRALLQHFGGLQAVTRASAEELAKVQGISLALAKTIHDTLHQT